MTKKHLRYLLTFLFLTIVGIGGAKADSYKKITSESEFGPGQYLIVYEALTVSDRVALTGSGTSAAEIKKGTKVKINNGEIDATEAMDNIAITIATDENAGYSLKTASGYYIYNSQTDKNGFYASTSLTTANQYTVTISFNNDGSANITSNGTYLRYNNAANNGLIFNYYKSSSYTSQQAIYLYKLDEGGSTSSYTITAQSNNTNYGTVSLNGSVITGSPNNGYRYADPAYSVSPANSATVVKDGNEFTVTPSANTTVTINFEAIPTYTVTLGDDNSTITEIIGGAGVTLPTRSALNGYEFAGWSETNVVEETTTAPTIIPAGTYVPTANITLYPVYTKTGGGTTPSAFSVGNTGNYAIVSAEQSGKYFALPTNPTVSSGKITAQEITVSEIDGVKFVTTANANGFTWTIATATNGYTLSDGSNYIYHSNGGASGTNVAYGTSTSYTWAFTSDGDYVTMAGMSGSTTNNRGLLFSGITIGGYALSNANNNGYYKVMILPISAGTTTYYWSDPVAAAVEVPAIVVAENPFLFSTTATITCTTEDAAIKYSFDKENWSDYTSALIITETKTIYAKAIKGENESDVAQVTATKNLATPTVTISGDLTLDLNGKTDVNAGTLTAAVTYNDAAVDGATVTWSSNKPEVATIDETTGAVTIKTTGSVTFTATYAGNADYAEATATKTVTVTDNNAPGSEGNPYSVEDAIAYINTLGSNTSANEVYVRGIISKVDEFFDKYKSITYWISDDGTTANQMEVYSGKGLNGADFSAVTDLAVGYEVTVKGMVKKYNETPEFDKSSVIVSLIRPKHTATFFQNGEKLSEATVEEGAAIEFPTPEEAIHGKQFVGWLPEEINGTTNEASPFTEATMGTTDVTYYAVYATVGSGSPASLTKMTSSDTFATGDKIVIVASDNIAMYQETANTSYVNKYTYDNNVATVAANDKNWLSVSAGSTNDTWKLGDDTNGYVYNGSSNNLVISTDNSTDFTLSWNSTESKFTLVGNNRWLSYRSDLDNKYFRMGGAYTSEGSGDIYFDIYKYNVGNIAYSDYCTTVVAPVTPAAPIVFHDSGEYEGTLSVPMFAQEGATIKYTVNGGDEQTYSGPVSVSETSTITAWAELDGVKSDVVTREYTIIEKITSAKITEGYYRIKNNGNGKYVNVAGRKTVTFVDDDATETAAGTVIKVKAEADGVKILRSQGVDVPGYAQRAINYVDDIINLAVEKLELQELFGSTGEQTLLNKFHDSFDYNLYLESVNNGYRIYGRTPSMRHVVDFYAENKDKVDAKLPMMEEAINNAINKVLDKIGKALSLKDQFNIHRIWENMAVEGLTEPVADNPAAISQFYTEILSSEKNVWNFAHEVAMYYVNFVEGKDRFAELQNQYPEYFKYWDMAKRVQPDFKYYIAANETSLDFISEGNEDILTTAARAIWTMVSRTNYTVNFNISQERTIYPTNNEGETITHTEYYTTLNTDFAYNVPEGVIAYQIMGIDEIKDNESMGTVLKQELDGTIPAQTPVLLLSNEESVQLELADDVDALSINELHGNEYLIKKDELKNSMLKTVFETIKENFGEDLYNRYVKDYEHLMLLNSGTVNNKYFFNLSKENDLAASKSYNSGMVMVLGQDDDLGVRFHYASKEDLKGNEAFMIDESNLLEDIVLTLKGDVNRDGQITDSDVTALVDIILGKARYPDDSDKYDFEAANVNGDGQISIADVTELVNIILRIKTN